MLGDGTTGPSLTPVPVVDALDDPLDDIVQIAGGADYGCVLRLDAQVYCWGTDSVAFAGLAPSTSHTTTTVTVPVDGLPEIASITAGQSHMCALSFDSDVFCWGFSSHGQVGTGSTEPEPVPVLVYSSFI